MTQNNFEWKQKKRRGTCDNKKSRRLQPCIIMCCYFPSSLYHYPEAQPTVPTKVERHIQPDSTHTGCSTTVEYTIGSIGEGDTAPFVPTVVGSRNGFCVSQQGTEVITQASGLMITSGYIQAKVTLSTSDPPQRVSLAIAWAPFIDGQEVGEPFSIDDDAVVLTTTPCTHTYTIPATVQLCIRENQQVEWRLLSFDVQSEAAHTGALSVFGSVHYRILEGKCTEI